MAVQRIATITFKAGTLTCATTVEQEPAEPTLTVNRAVIGADLSGGNSPITVTSNAHWTAAVNDEAVAWCTVSPEAGFCDGAATVSVTESTASRAATVTFSAGTLTRTVSVMQQATPPYAASANIWKFGEQIWSDAIQVIPECNKPEFTSSTSTPSCRSYTSGTTTWYYYNWPYVDTNKEELCPAPWRVPKQQDFTTLVSNLGGNTQSARDALIAAWGLGGIIEGSYISGTGQGIYWSSPSQCSTSDATSLSYGSFSLFATCSYKHRWTQVRCVKY
jgi:hypothetical protein